MVKNLSNIAVLHHFSCVHDHDLISNMFHNMPKAVGALEDADRVSWSGTDVAANLTGPHEVVGGYESADTMCLVRINVAHSIAT